MSILSNELHPSNAPTPISVTLSGISMLSKELHSRNAPTPISVTLLGITNATLLCFIGKRMIDVIFLSYNIPSTDLYTELFLETFIPSNEQHLPNALLPISVTLSGMSMLFNDEQQ